MIRIRILRNVILFTTFFILNRSRKTIFIVPFPLGIHLIPFFSIRNPHILQILSSFIVLVYRYPHFFYSVEIRTNITLYEIKTLWKFNSLKFQASDFSKAKFLSRKSRETHFVPFLSSALPAPFSRRTGGASAADRKAPSSN